MVNDKSIGHKIDELELISIFDEFASKIIDGELDQDVTDYLHEAVKKIASGKPINISKGDFTNLLTDFASLLCFDDQNGGYKFEFEDISSKGLTTIIHN